MEGKILAEKKERKEMRGVMMEQTSGSHTFLVRQKNLLLLTINYPPKITLLKLELSKWAGPTRSGRESPKNEGFRQPNFSLISTRAFQLELVAGQSGRAPGSPKARLFLLITYQFFFSLLTPLFCFVLIFITFIFIQIY